MAAIELASTPLFSDANLTNYWKLEGLTDSKGTATLTNTTAKSFVSALFNNGVDMGSAIRNTAELTVASNIIPAATASFSISTWFKANLALSASNPNPGILICSNASASGYAINIVPEWNAGTPRINVVRRTNVDVSDTVAWASNDTTAWHHIVHTYNGTTMINYFDGAAFSAGVATSGTFSATTYPFTSIGGSFMSNNATSIIDDTAYFSRVLTAIEVSNLYTGNFFARTLTLLGVG